MGRTIADINKILMEEDLLSLLAKRFGKAKGFTRSAPLAADKIFDELEGAFNR